MSQKHELERLRPLADHVRELRDRALALEDEFSAALEATAPDYRDSARNLVHYLSMRRRDLRALQPELSELGLSSLGRLESHVLASLDAVLATVHKLMGEPLRRTDREMPPVTHDRGPELLAEHAEAVLGPTPEGRTVRVMVTMPSGAATDPAITHDLLSNGMNVMRINGAHDDADAWSRMIEHLRSAERELGHTCRVHFDLGGPKLRTGPTEGGKKVRLSEGDRLLVTHDDVPGRRARVDDDGRVLEPAQIGCTLPQVFRDVRVGHRVFFDDGKLGGVVRAADADTIEVEITSAGQAQVKLAPDKGINLPDTELDLPALTDDDRAALDFAVGRVDLVGLSFVSRPSDILELVDEMESRGGRQPGIILKIETKAAFERLPALILTALRHPPVGVMLARGDLAIELGFERLAEVQEEILWVCEAAHVPTIWATQVLESLAKTGIPSRAEVTDAAMSGRAECVMLNKGPFIVQTCAFLIDVLERMQEHQVKKTAMLRELRRGSWMKPPA